VLVGRDALQVGVDPLRKLHRVARVVAARLQPLGEGRVVPGPALGEDVALGDDAADLRDDDARVHRLRLGGRSRLRAGGRVDQDHRSCRQCQIDTPHFPPPIT
jgi:hypothetical protein